MSSNAGRLNLSAGRGKISIASGENSTREVFRIRVVHWYAPHLREGNTGVVSRIRRRVDVRLRIVSIKIFQDREYLISLMLPFFQTNTTK